MHTSYVEYSNRKLGMNKFLLTLLFGLAVAHQAIAGFDEMVIKSAQSGNYSLAILVHDQREYILKREHPENVIGGYLKGIFRVRSNITTSNQGPLADEMADGIRKSFVKENWLAVATIATTLKDNKEDLASLIKTAKLKRNIVITVNELWVESYKNTSVMYNFNVAVFDDNAQLLARLDEQGTHETTEWGEDGAAEIVQLVILSAFTKPDFISAFK